MDAVPAPLCSTCGYDLTGLGAVGACPECGEAFGRADPTAAPSAGEPQPHRARFESLADAPVPYLNRLAFGAGLACLGGVFTVIVSISGALAPPQGQGVRLEALILLGQALWWVGVAVVCMPRRMPSGHRLNTRREMRTLRLLATASQAIWPVSTLLGLLSMTSSSGFLADALAASAFGLSILATTGLIPLCWWTGHLAHWAGNDRLSSQFTGSAWVFAVLFPTMLISAALAPWLGLIGPLLGIVAMLSSFGVAIAAVILLWAMLQLANDAFGARRVSSALRARDARRAERDRERAERLKTPLDDVQSGGDPSFVADLAESGSHQSGSPHTTSDQGEPDPIMTEELKRRLRSGNYIEPAAPDADDAPIELAPVDPPSSGRH